MLCADLWLYLVKHKSYEKGKAERRVSREEETNDRQGKSPLPSFQQSEENSNTFHLASLGELNGCTQLSQEK
jgi:hypothetical protein